MTSRARALVTFAGLSLLTGFCALLDASEARASYPAGWRARPLRVTVLPPSADVPEARARIEGVMAFTGSGVTAAPKCGVMDFFCRTGSEVTPFFCSGSKQHCEDLCRMAWQDIATAARAGQCVAFDLRLWHLPEQLVKPANAPFDAPNPFDPLMGVAIVPCKPEVASVDRPDLTVACDLATSAGDAGPEASTPDPTMVIKDAAAEAPAAPELPAAAPTVAPPTAGTTDGSTKATSKDETKPASATAARGANCHMAPGHQHASHGLLLVVAALWLGVRGRRRSPG